MVEASYPKVALAGDEGLIFRMYYDAGRIVTWCVLSLKGTPGLRCPRLSMQAKGNPDAEFDVEDA
jgi:hypothetical protein